MPRKHYSWKLGEPLPPIGAHSLAKHRVFEQYLRRYIRIVAPHPAQRELRLTIVDGFCGGGRYLHGGMTIEGSPIILLNATRAMEAELALSRLKYGFRILSDFFFVDKLQNHINFLRAEIEKSEYGKEIDKTIKLLAVPFESKVTEIIEFIRRKGSSQRSLFFLDQYGWSDVSFAAIRSIFEQLKHPEVLLTFSIDTLIDYFREETAKTRGGRAIDIDESFASELVNLRTEHGARYLIQNFLYKHIVEKTAARFYTPFFIRSADNHRSYWLLHLSTQERARDEMARLHWEMNNTFVHYGKAGFNALGFDPSVDPDQATLEFDFGANARRDSLNAAIEELPKLIRDDGGGNEPVTIGDLFRARCNETPLTMELVSEAVTTLRDDFNEIQIFTSENQLRPRARKLEWEDKVLSRPQRNFFRSFSIPRKK